LSQGLGADRAARRVFKSERSISLRRGRSRQFRSDRFNRQKYQGGGGSNIDLLFRSKFTSSVDQDSVLSRGLSDDMVFQGSTDNSSSEGRLGGLGGFRASSLGNHTISRVVDWTLRAVIHIVSLQNLIVFLSFTQLIFFLNATDLMVIASSMSLFLFKLLGQMLRQLRDSVASLTGTKDGVFLDSEDGEGAFLVSLDLVALLKMTRFKGLGKIVLSLGD